MARRTGVYVCEGCGIGGCVNTAALAQAAETGQGVVVTRTSNAFCLEDAALIRDDIAAQNLESVVIAACSPRVNRQVFDFAPTPVQRVNLREHVAWSHAPNEEATEELAADLLQMGIAAAQHGSPPTPYTEDHQRHVLVVGGGAAGLSAALSAAGAGYAVTLVEREAALGGFMRHLHRSFPTRAPYRELEDIQVGALVERVTSHPSITTLTSAHVGQITGQPGRFEVTIDRADGPLELEVGSVVEATGFLPVPDDRFPAYGLGQLPDVITSITMEELSAGPQVCRPSDGQVVRRVAILACDTQRDPGNLPYTGNVTSMVALKQAMYVRQRNPDAQVFIVYEDMQTPGRDEFFYRTVQEDPGVFFVRGEVTSVIQPAADGELVISVHQSVLAVDVAIRVDLVVLQVGMMPSTTAAEDTSPALNLKYLQGAKLPAGRAGFADSNFLCFPYETRRTGIYAAGCVHRSQDIAGSRRDGAAAALKAIQVVEKASVGAAVHPRVGELGFPQFFMQKCTSCGRCTQECPFGALELDPQRHPVLNTNRCRRCGICMGACPVQIISFPDYSVEMISAMQKAVSLPEDEEKLRVLVFACENDAYPAIDMAGINRLRLPAMYRVVPVRCLGSVNSIVVADAVQLGFDGVVLLGCRSGEDYQCHFIQGSELLGRRMDNVRETLSRLALEQDRVKVIETSIADSRRLPAVLAEFAAGITAMGPNPMKGF